MQYDEAVSYLLSILGRMRASHFGLDRMRELCRRLGDPQLACRVVHIRRHTPHEGLGRVPMQTNHRT